MAAILAAKSLAGVAPEVNLRECVTCTPLPSANKAAHSNFETKRRHNQNSKTGGISGPTKDLCPPKTLKNVSFVHNGSRYVITFFSIELYLEH